MIGTENAQRPLTEEIDKTIDFIKNMRGGSREIPKLVNYDVQYTDTDVSFSVTENILRDAKYLTLSSDTSGTLTSIPSLPRSISNEPGKPYEFLQMIEEDTEEDDFHSVLKALNNKKKHPHKHSKEKKKRREVQCNSGSTNISEISEIETLFIKEQHIDYKKFGRYISININGTKKTYDILQIYEECTPLKETQNKQLDKKHKKKPFFEKFKQIFSH
jgi:hypothetical protein